MAEKTVSGLGKVLAVVFTSFVAPVLVHVATKNGGLDEAAPAPTALKKDAAPPAPALSVTQIIVKGVGKTPEEAVRQALNTALVRVVAAQVDADTWSRSGEVLRASVTSDPTALIQGWRDLGGRKEWKLRGSIHHRELAVEVNRTALLERLRLTQVHSPQRSTESWQRVIAQPGHRG